MKVFVKDFCETVKARVIIFGMQVDNMFCMMGLQISLLIFILPCILSKFLSFHALNIGIS